MSNHEFSPVESTRPGENTRPEDANRRPESLDPMSLLQEGRTGEQRENLRESTGQAVQQGLLPAIEITDDGQAAPGEAPRVEPQGSAELGPQAQRPGVPTEQPAQPQPEQPTQPQLPTQPEQPTQPEARQPRRGTLQAGAVAAARANTPGADAEIAAADPLPDAPPTTAGEVANGFVSHIVDHPIETGAHLLAGAGATVIAGLASPGLATAALIGGGAYLAYRGVETALNIAQAAPVFNNPEAHTPEEVARARAQLREAGGSGAGLFISAAGGGAAGAGGHAIAARVGSGMIGRAAARMSGSHASEGAAIIREAERHIVSQPFERIPGAISNFPLQPVGNDGEDQNRRRGRRGH